MSEKIKKIIWTSILFISFPALIFFSVIFVGTLLDVISCFNDRSSGCFGAVPFSILALAGAFMVIAFLVFVDCLIIKKQGLLGDSKEYIINACKYNRKQKITALVIVGFIILMHSIPDGTCINNNCLSKSSASNSSVWILIVVFFIYYIIIYYALRAISLLIKK